MASKKDKKTASILSKYFLDSEKSDLINMLTYHEGGFYSVAYMDSKDIPTAGVGINLSNVQNLTKKQKAGQESIDAKRLQKLFIKRLNRSTSDAISFVGGTKAFRKLSTTRKSILVQMAFNLGLTKLNGFKRFKTYTRAAIAAKGKKEELGLWSNAQMEMIDSDWHNDVGMRALDFEKSFLDDNYYISDELQTSQTLLDLASKKNAIAAKHDQEELRKLAIPQTEADPIDRAEKILKTSSVKPIGLLDDLLGSMLPKKRGTLSDRLRDQSKDADKIERAYEELYKRGLKKEVLNKRKQLSDGHYSREDHMQGTLEQPKLNVPSLNKTFNSSGLEIEPPIKRVSPNPNKRRIFKDPKKPTEFMSEEDPTDENFQNTFLNKYTI